MSTHKYPDKRLILGLAAVISAVTLLVIFYGSIAVFLFSAYSGMDVSYKRVNACSVNELIFRDLSAIRRKDGIGISSDNGSVKFVMDRRWTLACDFALNDVKIIRKGSEKVTSLNSIDGLISAPFAGITKYNTLSGNISFINNGIFLRNLLASGDQIRFSLDGMIAGDNLIDASITIYFSDILTGTMPPELSGMILKGDSDGWRSLSFKVQGDLAKPAIKVTGKLFRLNIGLKS